MRSGVKGTCRMRAPVAKEGDRLTEVVVVNSLGII